MTAALIAAVLALAALSFYFWRKAMNAADLLTKANATLADVQAKVDADETALAAAQAKITDDATQIQSLQSQLDAAGQDQATMQQISDVLDQIDAAVKSAA